MVRQLYLSEEVDHGLDHGIGICNHLGVPSVHHKLDNLLAVVWVAVLYPACHLCVFPTVVYGHLVVEVVGRRCDGRREVDSDRRFVDDSSCLRFQSRHGRLSLAHLPNYQCPFPQYLLSVRAVEQLFGL
jgi:hypothetical protein